MAGHEQEAQTHSVAHAVGSNRLEPSKNRSSLILVQYSVLESDDTNSQALDRQTATSDKTQSRKDLLQAILASPPDRRSRVAQKNPSMPRLCGLHPNFPKLPTVTVRNQEEERLACSGGWLRYKPNFSQKKRICCASGAASTSCSITFKR